MSKADSLIDQYLEGDVSERFGTPSFDDEVGFLEIEVKHVLSDIKKYKIGKLVGQDGLWKQDR